MSSTVPGYFKTTSTQVMPPLGLSASVSNLFSETVFNQGPIGFFEWRPKHNGFSFSPSIANLLGYSQESLPLNSSVLAAHIYPDDYGKVKLHFAKVMITGANSELTFRMIKQDASPSWFHLQLQVILNEDDEQISCVVGYIVNVDWLVQHQEDIHKSNEINNSSLILQLLSQEPNNDEVNHCLKIVCDAENIDNAVLFTRNSENTHYVATNASCSNPHATQQVMDIIISDSEWKSLSSKNSFEPLFIYDVGCSSALPSRLQATVQLLGIHALAILPIQQRQQTRAAMLLMSSQRSHHWATATVERCQQVGKLIAQHQQNQFLFNELNSSRAIFQNSVEASQDGVWDWDIENNNYFVSPTFLYMLGYDEDFLPLTREKIVQLLLKPNKISALFDEACFTNGFSNQQIQFRHRSGKPITIWTRYKQLSWNKQGIATRCVGVNVDMARLKSLDSNHNSACGNKNSIDIAQPQLKAKLTSPPCIQDDDELLRASRILLAEDNPINQQVATGILKRKGVDVTIVNNGQEAVDLLNSSPIGRFDCVLMDMEMPVLDGYAATQSLRKQRHFQDLPIIALTAHASDEDKNRCFSLGMNDHVAKPVKPDLLYSAIVRQIGNKAQTHH